MPSESELFRMAEFAAPDENRTMPADRVYAKSSKTVSVEEALALMKQRRKDPSARIPGGLDEVVQKKNPENKETGTPSRRRRRSQKSASISTGQPIAEENTADFEDSLNDLHDGISEIKDLLLEMRDPKVEKENDELKVFKSDSHWATFLISGMKFTTRCLNMVKDDASHCLVLAFPDDGVSFFEPPQQSELELQYDGKSVGGRLFYFGMCFAVRQLGLRFLGFLFDELNKREG